MKKMILPLAISLVILLVATCGFAQDYDLIVTTKGDSIACRIDSITETHIYFEMKSQNHWAQTHIDLTDVSENKRNAIDKKQYIYQSGTSIIESPRQEQGSIRDIQKNSVYVGVLSINYARMIPLGQTTGLTLGGGLINIDGWGVVAESSVLLGDVKHFLELGIMGAYFFASNKEPDNPESGDVVSAVSLRIGYRYQGPKGFLFRSALLLGYLSVTFEDDYLNDGVILLPALSIGYSF
jgi:hypothetical protein